ncbi:MAG: OmpA family protein, partial [Elusimicrobiota bacterium]|nr:OmpA family protein [Elusimicrobiota bacterium]
YGKENINYYGNLGLKYHIKGKIKDIKDVNEANKAKKAGAVISKESKIIVSACEFAIGEYELDERAQNRVNQLAQEIKQLKYTKITITINLPDDEFIDPAQYDLAIQRARAVYNHLYEKGIEINKMTYEVMPSVIIDEEYAQIDHPTNRVEVEIDYLRD